MVTGRLSIAVMLCVLFSGATAAALEPNEILVIVNGDIKQSVKLGRYYCQKRNVPKENILTLSLGKTLADAISRDDYDKRIAGPIREKLAGPSGWAVKCLLTTYGVPYKVGPRSSGEGADNRTDASVDSDLSMVRFGAYELRGWQPNQLNKNSRPPEELILTIMVCRLDGPTPQIARGLVDKAIKAEKTGLHGAAYIDSRGIPDDKQPYSTGHFDQSLRDLAVLLRLHTTLEVKEERTEKLFGSTSLPSRAKSRDEQGGCPRTAIYCGWYSLKKYVDSFDFVDGAVGFHIASLEAVDLRDANSTEWCPAMLTRGVTATLGAVAEPYLQAFPKPDEFFFELLDGSCLVEAFYRTQPFCSWQLVLVSDPLYRPFGPSTPLGVVSLSNHK